MTQLSLTAYRALFLKHVYQFLGKIASSRELSGSHAVAVSGGPDSMALLWLASTLHQEKKIGPVRALFVHHHTRQGQDHDAKVVREFCESMGIPFHVLHASGLIGESSNFEKKARVKRRELLLGDLKPRESLWLGHQVDDSFEWSLMQKFRSNHPQSSLGIPVRNGRIIRPLLCVTRQQLTKLVKNQDIPFIDDPTNKDRRFDRNYIRHEIIPRIKKRYPRYLKHYVYFSNSLAALQKLSLVEQKQKSLVYCYKQGAALEGKDFDDKKIQELLIRFSKSDRGEITTQIGKMLKAIHNGKKGPFHFSGRTEAYYSHHLLMIYNQGFKNNDHKLAAALKILGKDELSSTPLMTLQELESAWNKLLASEDGLLNLPGLVLVLESKSICKTLNTCHNDSLFPEVSQLATERNLAIVTASKCLDTWSRKKSKLPESLRLIPLWHLSHLFAFQASRPLV